jgi:RNA polymerase sigma-70 factor (ECF subfamily)
LCPESIPDWSWIVQTHGGRVFGVAMRILGSVQDAEDVSQDVFLEACEIYSAGAVQSWAGLLVRLATLRSLDLRRRHRPTAELFERDCTASSDPAARLIRNELAESLSSAVIRLPDKQATVFIMSCYEEMARDEIAGVLRISPEAVSTLLYKARQRLAEDLNHLYKEIS